MFNLFRGLFFILIATSLFGENPPQINDWQTRLEYARVLSYLKKYKESLVEYQKILREKPDLTEAQIEMAKVYYYEGDYAAALRFLDKIPSKNKTPDIDLLIADIYLTQKKYPEAEAIYNKYLNQLPDKKDAILLKLAEIYSWQKKYDDSLAIYKDLVARHPDDTQLIRKYAMVLTWAGKHQEAAEQLKKTLE